MRRGKRSRCLNYKMVKIICERCKKVIKDEEQRFSIKEQTIKPAKVFIDYHFHSNCWVEHYNDSLDKKITAYSKRLMSITAPALKEIINSRRDGGSAPLLQI